MKKVLSDPSTINIRHLLRQSASPRVLFDIQNKPVCAICRAPLGFSVQRSDIDGLARCADEGIVDQASVAEKDGHGGQHLLARFYRFNRLHRLDADHFGVLETRIGGLGHQDLHRFNNLEILRRLAEFSALGRPILVGMSRKSSIGYVLDVPPDDRVEGTAATVALSIANGADMVRVHDVREMVRVARMSDAIVRGWTQT